MAGEIFTATIVNMLKATLEDVIKDSPGRGDTDFEKWCDMKSMKDQYVDVLQFGGPGLASEKGEGEETNTVSVKEGYLTRFFARTFAARMLITEEAVEDCKYDEVLNAGGMLSRSIWKTADIDATNMLVFATDTTYTGGDGLSLANAAHTLPHGGTYSNTLAVPMAPGKTAVVTMTSLIKKLPALDGTIEGFMPKRVLCPTEQWYVWKIWTKSEMAPEAGNFAEINVVKDLGLEVIPLKHWSNTTTNWAMQTTCPNGLQFRFRVRPQPRSWVDKNRGVFQHAIRSRWSKGWSDPRGLYFSNA
jgi:hypothetical protein